MYGDDMKKWIFILAFLLIFVVIQSIYLYNRALEPINKAEKTAVRLAEEHYKLKKIKEVTYFNGEESFQIIHALDNNDENIIIWVPEKNTKNLVMKKKEDGLTEKQVKKFAVSELDIKKLKDIRLGMKQGTPVWEITFIDSEGRYSFYYLQFDGETWIENYRLKAI